MHRKNDTVGGPMHEITKLHMYHSSNRSSTLVKARHSRAAYNLGPFACEDQRSNRAPLRTSSTKVKTDLGPYDPSPHLALDQIIHS
jgi:hypothetical protein